MAKLLGQYQESFLNNGPRLQSLQDRLRNMKNHYTATSLKAELRAAKQKLYYFLHSARISFSISARIVAISLCSCISNAFSRS